MINLKTKSETRTPDNYFGRISDDRAEFIQRLKWMNKIRTAVGIGLFLLTFGLYLYFYFFEPQKSIIFFFQKRLLVWTLIIEFIEIFINTPYSFLIKRMKGIELFGIIQATLDMLLITAFTYLFGGTDFPVSTVIYAFGIALIGFIFHKGMAYWLAFVSSIGYCFIIIGQNLNWIPVIRTTYWELDLFEQTVLISFNIAAFFLMAYFSGDVVDMLEGKIISLRNVLAERDKLYIKQEHFTEALRKSEADLHEAQAISHIGNWEADFDKNTTFFSKEAGRLFGLPENSNIISLDRVLALVHPDDKPLVISEMDRFKSGESQPDFRFRISRTDGNVHWVHCLGQNDPDKTDAEMRMVGTLQDITAAKKSEEALQTSLREKEILLKEIHHRVKNNLQIISSLLYLQSKNIENEETLALFTESQGRVKSMALIHEKLYQDSDLANIDFVDYVKNLTSYLIRTYRVEGQGINVHYKVDDISLDLDTAVPCGLIINELITNSLKYAFPEKGRSVKETKAEWNPEISISFVKDNDPGYCLTIADNGCGIPEEIDFEKTKSLGLKLVSSLVNQLKGTVEMERKEGAVFKIVF